MNLIILTADRPPELWGVANGLSCNKICLPITQWQVRQSTETSGRLCGKMVNFTLEQACYKTKQQPGVVHINVPLQSHFYNAQEQEIDSHPWLMPIQRWLSQPKNWSIINHYSKKC